MISGTTQVTSPIAPTDITDLYPTHDAIYGKGGLRNVNTYIERNAIPNLRRIAGMIVGISFDDTFWKLKNVIWDGTNNDWEIFILGSTNTYNNGLTNVLGNVQLGGLLTQDTLLDGAFSSQVEFKDLTQFNVISLTTNISATNAITLFTNGGIDILTLDSATGLSFSSPLDFGVAISGSVTINGDNFQNTLAGVFAVTASGAILLEGLLFSFSNYNSGLTISDNQVVAFNGSNNQIVLDDQANSKGAVYADDYSANFTPESLVSKRYVDSAITTSAITADNGLTLTSGNIQLGGMLTQDTVIDGDGNYSLSFVQLRQFNISSGEINVSVNDDYSTSATNYGVNVVSASHYSSSDAQYLVKDSTNSAGLYMYFSAIPASDILDGDVNLVIKDMLGNKGLVYDVDYSSNFTKNSLVSKFYVDNKFTGLTTSYLPMWNGTSLVDSLVFYDGNPLHFISIQDNNDYAGIKSTSGGSLLFDANNGVIVLSMYDYNFAFGPDNQRFLINTPISTLNTFKGIQYNQNFTGYTDLSVPHRLYNDSRYVLTSALNLSNVLTNGNTTNDIAISSNDGNSSIEVNNGNHATLYTQIGKCDINVTRTLLYHDSVVDINTDIGGTINIGTSADKINLLGTSIHHEAIPDVTLDILSGNVTTSDDTLTNILTINIPTDSVVIIETKIHARKITGIGIGSVGQGNAYIRIVKVINASGVLSLGTISSSYTSEDITSFNVSITTSGTNVLINVLGTNNNTVNWTCITNITK